MNWNFWTRTQPTDPDDCAAIDPLLSLYADGMASAEEARCVEAHLPACESCRASLAWMRATRFALASRPVALPPADLRARIASAIAASSDVPVSFNTRRAFAVRPAYAAAASVALLGFVGYGLLHHPQPAAVHPAPPPLVAAKPSADTTAPVIKTVPGPGIKPHITSHPAPAARHTRLDSALVAQNHPHEALPAPVVVRTHIQAKPETRVAADAAPVMAAEKAHPVMTRKPAPRKFRPEMLATNKGPAPAAETHKIPIIKPEPKNTDTVVAEVPHTQTSAAPSIIEKQPVITPDPAPTVTIASNGGGRLQTAEGHSSIKLHLVTMGGAFTHATFKVDKSVAIAVRAIDQNRTPSIDINHGGF